MPTTALLPAAALLLCATQAAAMNFPEQREADFAAGDFKLQSGETLNGLRLHYTTVGTPHRGEGGRIDNAVLLLHGTTGTGKNFLSDTLGGELFGPGQPLDAARYYLILPDGLGRGGSSKPSDGLRARFPKYGYGDLVTAQHLLVTKGLGVEHLRLVCGTSMGGMQAWMWAERYPGLMDGVLPVAAQPAQVSGRNLIFRRIVTESIRGDPDWNGGDYQAPPTHWLAVAPLWPLILDSPVRLQSQAPTRAAALALYDKQVEAAKKWDANDFLYWLESSYDYDPEPDLGKVKARVIAVNFADDALNPAQLPSTERLVKSVPGAKFVLVPESEKTIGHQTLSLAAQWKQYAAELLAAPASK